MKTSIGMLAVGATISALAGAGFGWPAGLYAALNFVAGVVYAATLDEDKGECPVCGR